MTTTTNFAPTQSARVATASTPVGDRPVAMSARRATKVYGSDDTQVLALNEVNVDFTAGCFTAIMGPSGSGKSTLMHCMAGLDRLTSGDVFIGSYNITDASDNELTRLRRDRLGFVFQAFNLVPTLSVEENITLPIDLAGNRVDQQWLDELVATVGLTDRLSHKPKELSGGQQQRVAVARALASRPEIIFADEPTGNLDSSTGAEILEFLRHAVRSLGQTIAMVTHDPVAASFADRVVFLADGQVVSDLADPSPDAVLDQMRVISH